ncbi:DUF6985 domain-containing protein [Ruminococcus albus]|uniref:DUF6985 domain-containing protein n=1 Tax=Ruminococcus albus TaxID=1264 RepID=A0A1H7LLD1_RUMAL|nr:hypothetical protein [Ruminococcus albus]SEK99782.1 hypothetical protein SAMN05216469_10972 [Ruminococcus albus]
MQNNLLLDPERFEIVHDIDDEEKNNLYCKRLIEKWTPELEKEMLEAFIRFYYDNMYMQWGPDDEEECKEYWPEFGSPADLVNYIGTDVEIYALEDAIYASNPDRKEGDPPYVSQNVPVCVIMVLNCPWDEDHGWAAVFADEKFLKVDSDIVDCVWLD